MELQFILFQHWNTDRGYLWWSFIFVMFLYIADIIHVIPLSKRMLCTVIIYSRCKALTIPVFILSRAYVNHTALLIHG